MKLGNEDVRRARVSAVCVDSSALMDYCVPNRAEDRDGELPSGKKKIRMQPR